MAGAVIIFESGATYAGERVKGSVSCGRSSQAGKKDGVERAVTSISRETGREVKCVLGVGRVE